MTTALLRALRTPAIGDTVAERVRRPRTTVLYALHDAIGAGLVCRRRSGPLAPYIYALTQAGRERVAITEALVERVGEADASLRASRERPWEIAARLGWPSANEMVDDVLEWRRRNDSAAVAEGARGGRHHAREGAPDPRLLAPSAAVAAPNDNDRRTP